MKPFLRASALVLTLALLVPAHAAEVAKSPEENLAALAITLPAVKPPVANYVSVVRSGNLLYLAGHIPRDASGNAIAGKVGRDMDEAAAAQAARTTAIALIATLKNELGDLKKVRRIVRVSGFVNATENFTKHPQVINGCSDLLVAVFGEKGRHARTALGAGSLPLGAAVEIELIAEVD